MFGAGSIEGDDDLSFVSNNRLCRVCEGNKDIETVFNKHGHVVQPFESLQ